MVGKYRWTAALMSMAFIMAPGCVTVDYVADAKARVGAANWGEMETVSVVLKEYSYTPSSLHFEVGVPYKLQIENTGTLNHYFTAEQFFRAIATRKVQSNTDGEIKAPYFSAFEVASGGSLDLYFIPVTRGTYQLHCTITGHEAKGMHATIVIE